MATIIANNDKILPHFLFYLLCGIDANNLTENQNYPSLRLADIETIKIPLPPLEVQQEIIAEIDGYQKIIDGARQVVENYKPTIKIDPDWEVVELGEVIDFVSGLTLSIPKSESEDGVPIISMNSIDADGVISYEGIRTIELPKKKTINYCQKGDLLFNWRNGSKHLVGKTGYFDFEGKYVFASFLLGIRVKPESLISKFLWYMLNNYRKEGRYLQFMRMNVNGLFNRKELKILKIPLPPLSIKQEIVARIEEEQKLVEANKRLIEIYEQKIKDKIGEVWGE
ncbi:restriction endonuclease subunit S [bacterium]|nr:restriction endonuclease subunit S [bacterium]